MGNGMIFSVVFESFLRNPNGSLTVDQYRLHMQVHRKRVKHLGMILYNTFFSDCPDLSPDLVSEFLELHDVSKVDDSLSPGNPIALRLAQTFGKDQSLPEVQEAISLAVADLNMIDQEVALNFFREKGLLVESVDTSSDSYHLSIGAKKLLQIENIADLVDRGFDKIAHIEFGRVLARASEFLVDSRDRLMARHLELVYGVEVAAVEAEHSGAVLRELYRSSR
jgi:hypothetical protein